MKTKNPLHMLAAISVIGGLFRVFALETGSGVVTRNIVMSQYLLWAILFEIAALNVKE